MEIMIGERMIDIPQDEVDRLVGRHEKRGSYLKYGDMYWIVDTDGDVRRAYWDGGYTDNKRLARGNVFETQEGAESHADWLKAVAEIRRTSDFIPDWNDESQTKFMVYYDHADHSLAASDFRVYQYQSVVYYATSSEAKQAIKSHKSAYLTYFGIEASEEEN